MSTDRRIKGLKTRQKSLLASFGLIKAFVDTYEEETGACEIPVRLENLDALWSDFKQVQTELETLDETTIDQQLKYRTDFETSYYRVKGFLLSLNKVPSSPPLNTSLSSHIPASSSHVRLPDVKLPVFNGNLDSWLNFHDLFVSLVHSSVDLSSIQKFYYLRSSVAGEALKLIQTIPISANNYIVAWNLLVDHFQNTARLKQSYLDALFEFPMLKRESAADLHSLVEKFETNVKVLKQLGEKTEFWDIILIRMLSSRLDPTTRRDWEEYSLTKDATAFSDLASFIQRRVSVLQTIQGKFVEAPLSTQPFKKSAQRPVASHGASQFSYGRKCIICSDHHPLYLCSSFAELDIEGKEKEVRRNQLCRNCLRKGHQARDCPSSSSCRKCRGRHHTQLCSGENSVAVNSRTIASSQSMAQTASTSGEHSRASVSATIQEPASYATTGHPQRNALLATAIVKLVDDNGTTHLARALLDSGSECCFITESFAQLVKAKRYKISVPISGIGQSSTFARYKIVSTIRSRVCDYSTSAEFLVLPKVTIDLPTASFNASSLQIPPGVQLADPSFCKANPVDIIIGAEIFFDLFKVSGRIQLGESFPTLVNSVLGWIVSGKASYGTPTTPVIANVATFTDLHKFMEKFWTIEENDTSPCYSVEETACEEHFRRTVRRNAQGRYVVRLPLKEDVLKQLGDNRRTAIRRFRMLEGRLGRNQGLAQQYRDFVEEYLALGHMKQVFDYQSPPTACYHMPHHAVVRDESTTTKLRVVFDASCKTPEGPSLNDALMVGPTVQQEIRSIIMRARIRRIMIIADAKQMYRQVLVDERDTPLLRIVWKPAPDSPLETYELLTVTYGTASAPFLATRVLRWVHPFLSVDHLLRIGGRLNQAPQPYDSKHQIILPGSHAFSTLLVRSHHEMHLHAAPQLLVTVLRLRYWITGARKLAKSIVHNCITCVRARPKLLEQFMAELPASRVTATRPFAVTGVDYWGPILLQPTHRRAAPQKAYVAVFVCFSTRAVHLELVLDLSSAKFLQALRRFVSRRGLCSDIYSDNGRNFIGASNELQKIVRSKEYLKTVNEACANIGIHWHFNPPRASHFGGLWEAAIRSAQKHFTRVLGNHTLPQDDMETLLTQIECCLNSRPIVPMSDDPSDLQSLTPGHFLVGSALKNVPEIDVTEIPFNRLRRWQQTQKMFQLIWKRWHAEYLSTLQPRVKWCDPPIAIRCNQLVILKDENTPPMAWPMGRIIELHPGRDGVTRVVTVQTSAGRYTRPVSKICVLPIPPAQQTASK